MSNFTWIKQQGQLLFDDWQGRQKYINRIKDKQRGVETLRKPKQLKTDSQLGYYWGFLIPEIVKELSRQENTYTIYYREYRFEEYYDAKEAHKLLKKLCSKIDNGKYVTLSEQDKYLTMRYIDNVLRFAVDMLGMNKEALESKRKEFQCPTTTE